MKELIKITEKDGNSVVSARELHTFLEVKTEMVLWCKRMFEYGFVENVDYVTLKSERSVNKQVKIYDYVLTLDTAKEKLLNNKRGIEIAEYFEKHKINSVDYNLLLELLNTIKDGSYIHTSDLRNAIDKRKAKTQ